MSYNSKQLKVQSSAKKLPKPKDVDYISKMGYRDDSPFRDNSYNDIYTPNGIIDMSQTGIPLFANGQYLPPYSGTYDMGTENVREIPVAKKGGQKGLRKFTSKNIQTSLNDIMQRNTTLFGPSGKKRYKPDLNYKYGGWLDTYQTPPGQTGTEWKSGAVSQSDTVRNMAGNQMRWEHSRGDRTGIGLSNYGNPDLAAALGRSPTEQEAVDDYMQKIYPQVKDKYPTAMEQVIAGDLLYNAGKEAYNYLNWDNRKNPVVSQQNWDKTKITLTEDARRKALNNARDKYYKNTSPLDYTDPKTGKVITYNYGRDAQGEMIKDKYGAWSPTYKNTWYGRQNASDQYVPYTEQDFTNKNNDLFYKKQYGGKLNSYQNKGQVNTSNWKKKSVDSMNLHNRGEEMVKWAKENPNFTTVEHNKKADELDIKYPVSSMPWSGKNSFIGATNWANINSTKSGNWGVPLYDKPVGVQKEIKQPPVIPTPIILPPVTPTTVAVPKVQTEYVIQENNFGPPIKYRINRDTKQYYPITDIPKDTKPENITTIPWVNEMKKYGGWLDQYQDGNQVSTNKIGSILGDDGKPMLNIQPEVEIIDNKLKSPLLIGTKGSFINSNGSDNVWDKVKQQWVAPPKYPGLQPQLIESKSKIPTRVEEIPSKRIINPLTEIYKPVAESTGVPVHNAATINQSIDAAELSKLAPFIAAEKRNQEATAVARYRNEQARANGTATGLYDETNEVRKYLYQQDKKKADEDRTAVMMAGLALAPAALYIAGVPAVSTALATGFGAHGVYSIPNTYRNWVAAADPNSETTWEDALGTTALNALDFWGTEQVLKQGSRLYNTVATGQSALPIAWKSQAVGLSQEASQKMFNSLVNSGKLTDAERALIVEYQHNSKPFTGRDVPVNLEKQQA